MRPVAPTLCLLAMAALSACDADTSQKTDAPTVPSAPKTPTDTAGGQKKPGAPEIPSFPPLTPEVAKKVLHDHLALLGADDESRRALLYLADLGDRTGVNVLHEKLLTVHEGRYEDLPAAAIGAEAMIAYGEKDGAATVLKVAKEYAATQETWDENIVRALGRVEGEGRAEAVAMLITIATSDEEDAVPAAVRELARMGAPEAADAFAKIAANKDQPGAARGSAVAGLLRLSDARGKELAAQLSADLHPKETDHAAKGAKEESPAPEPEDVIDGLGVEGADGAVAVIRSICDTLIAEDDAGATFAVPVAASAIARVHVKGGGTELTPWLHELAKKQDAWFEDSSAFALWALGDDSAAAEVATSLRGMVANWKATVDMASAVEILDIAARRGVAAKEPFAKIVDSAAQLDPTRGKDKGTDYNLVALKLAAAHAYLKSVSK